MTIERTSMGYPYTGKGPILAEFEKDLEGVVRRELITYRYRDGMMVKEKTVRSFKTGGDYHDTTTVIPLPEIGG